MHIIVKITFGSHLYGTATEHSDLDIKGVYLPSWRDIVLQRVKSSVSFNSQNTHTNSPTDIDFELYSPEKFLALVAAGQTVALDMLFAPHSAFIEEPHALWTELTAVARQLLTKQAASFVRYCSQQANKYGIKGVRISAAKLALEYLQQAEAVHGTSAKLAVLAGEFHNLVAHNEFLSIEQETAGDGSPMTYFKICGKKAVFNATIKSAREIAQKLVASYGERALAAESQQGIDWKALSHAVRIGREALEYLATHRITFPRSEAAHLLDIKQGKLPFHQVADEIEKILEEVEVAMKTSTLPEIYDHAVIDAYILQLYRKQVLQGGEHANSP